MGVSQWSGTGARPLCSSLVVHSEEAGNDVVTLVMIFREFGYAVPAIATDWSRVVV